MAVRHAREQGARVIAICNTHGSTIPRESDAVLYTHAGPEIAVASTKAFLAQITACYLLGLYLAQLRGNKFADEVARDPRPAAGDAGQDPEGARRPRARCAQLARWMADTRSVLFLGRHVGYPVALEGALKLKELAYIHAEGFAAGELKHGPIALIEAGPAGLRHRAVARAAATRCTARSSPTSRRSAPAARAPSSSPRRATTRSCRSPTEVIRVPQTPTLLAPLRHRRPAAGLRLRARHRQGPRRRPAAQPRQVRHGRVSVRGRRVIVGVGIDVVDVARFERAARAHAPAARAAVHRRPSATCRWQPRRPVRGQGGRSPRRSAPRPGCAGTTSRSSPRRRRRARASR